MFDCNFMLEGEEAKLLYKNYAKDSPIYDFHCHLPAEEIYEDKEFDNISKVWLQHDHYKWRAMRYAGVPEKYITGDGDDFEKFKYWARICERLVGSPLYAWTNMELKTFFSVDEVLKENNAERIYNQCNKKIREEHLSPVKLITDSNVKLICTTDDPVDDLKYHKLLTAKNLSFKVLPTFRPDKAINILHKDFLNYVKKLSDVSSLKINTYSDLLEALKNRLSYFIETGCKLSDHSVESLMYLPTSKEEAEVIFNKRLDGNSLSVEEVEKFKCYTLKQLAEEYNKKNVVMQLHIGAMRNNNEVMYNKLGVDTGFDIMNDFRVAPHLSKLLNEINTESGVPKMVLYNCNAKDNSILSAIPHCFSGDNIPGKVQFGAPWWFNDNKEGIKEHFKVIANQGMLAYFIGMLTDSRSFLSYPRHDYFRRILCSYLGELVERNEFENDPEILKEIIEGICFKNIKRYLALED